MTMWTRAVGLLCFVLPRVASFTAPKSFTAPLRANVRLGMVQADAPPVAEAADIESLRFLTPEKAREVAAKVGTPTYVYSEAMLTDAAKKALAFPNAYGLTARFAMKACPNAAVLKLFTDLGLHIDASSGFEVRRAVAAGVPASHISLSSQEFPDDLKELVEMGIEVNACSLSQLERYCEAFPGRQVGIRFNPGMGSGGTGKTNVGGPDASFGVWHEWAPQCAEVAAKNGNKVVRIHTHIGSGSDPEVWQRVSTMSLDLCRKFPEVEILNLGGGYKVGRMKDEASTDLSVVGKPVQANFEKFAEETGRKLRLEIEPGTFLVANAGSLVTKIQDIVSTGAGGRNFLKLDSGMTEVLRPSLYGAQHPLVTVPATETGNVASYVVVGHCCESGDLMTPASGDPETVDERMMQEAQIGDLCVVEGSGAYCSAMSSKNYNSFPEAPEVMLMDLSDSSLRLIRAKQPLEQIWQNEVNEAL